MKIKKICEQCGKEFWIEYGQRKRKYYSRKCFHEYHKKAMLSGIVKNCSTCGIQIYVQKCLIKEKNYCSKKCAYKGNRKRKKAICKGCGKPFERVMSGFSQNKGNYCSKECFYKNHPRREKWIIKYCKFCGKKLTAKYPSALKRKNFCSSICLHAYIGLKKRRGKDIPCETCGKLIYVRPCEKNRKKYCSKACFDIAQTKKIKKRCIICGKQFLITQFRENKNWGKYCSIECFTSSDEFKYRVKNNFNKNDYLFNWLKGIMFGKEYEPNELDKEIIRTRMRLFKIHHKEVTHETS